MFCPYCGTKIDDDSKFCTNCGAKVDGAIPQQPNPDPNQPNPNQQQSAPNYGKYDTMSSLTLATVKKLAKSPLLLAAVIIFTLGILLTLTRNPVRELTTLIGTMFGDELGYDNYYDIMDALDDLSEGAGIVSNIIGNIPAILYAVGMWMVVVPAFDKTKTKLSSGGLTLIKVLVIISFISTILIIAAAAAIVFVLAMVIADEYYIPSGSVVGILICSTLVILAIIVLCVFYYVKLVKTINNIRYTVRNSSPVADISGLVIFMCFLGGICGIATSLFNFTALLNAVSSLLFGIVLLQYKQKMRFLIANGKNYISPQQ